MTHPDATRVLFDATNLKPVMSGQRTFTTGVIEALGLRDDIDLTVLTSVHDAAPSSGALSIHVVSERVRNPVVRAAWREAMLSRLAMKHRSQVIFSPTHELPLRGLRLPAVATIHDAGPLEMSSIYSRGIQLRHRVALRRIASNATRILCVTDAASAALRRILCLSPGKLATVGSASQIASFDVPPYVRADGRPYLLYVGALFKHKNVPVLLRALARLGEHAPTLILVGPLDAGQRRNLEATIARTPLARPVDHLGFVDVETLAALYRGATAVVLPSLYEGFGLPVLEAMLAGTPVIATDLPAIREVAGDAAVLVNEPCNPDAWASAIALTFADAELRAGLVARGRLRSGKYSWDRVATRIVENLRDVAAV